MVSGPKGRIEPFTYSLRFFYIKNITKGGFMKLRMIVLSIVFFAHSNHAKCLRAHKQHEDKNVVRCLYNQEDICRGYANNPGKYGCIERWKRCWYCGCKMDEHTKEKKDEP